MSSYLLKSFFFFFLSLSHQLFPALHQCGLSLNCSPFPLTWTRHWKNSYLGSGAAARTAGESWQMKKNEEKDTHLFLECFSTVHSACNNIALELSIPVQKKATFAHKSSGYSKHIAQFALVLL